MISITAKTQIPNFSFEDWDINGNDTVLKNNWQGQNISIVDSAKINTQQGIETRLATDGNTFVALSNTDTNQNNILEYGFLFSKFAYKGRPKSLTFSNMYTPKLMGESFSVVVTLTTANGDTISNTIAGGYTNAATEWRDIGINLNYNFPNPASSDSCYLRFFMLPNSSRNASLETKFYLDNLRFSDNFFTVDAIDNINSKVNLYPNPASNSTTVSFKLNTPSLVHLTIYDVTGKEVYSTKKQFDTGEAKFKADIFHLKQGLYTYTLRANEHTKTGKLIIKK